MNAHDRYRAFEEYRCPGGDDEAHAREKTRSREMREIFARLEILERAMRCAGEPFVDALYEQRAGFVLPPNVEAPPPPREPSPDLDVGFLFHPCVDKTT